MATYNLRDGIPSRIKAGDVLNYPYHKTVNNTLVNYGGAVTVPLPKGEYILEAWGSCAGSFTNLGTIDRWQHDGSGGYAKGTLRLSSKTDAILTAGGPGYNGTRSIAIAGSTPSGAGGASDIRLVQNTINHRVLVAGGGGNSGEWKEFLYMPGTSQDDPIIDEGYCEGGYGGGQTGGDGGSYTGRAEGGAGTATSAGSNGAGPGGGWRSVPAAFGMGGYYVNSYNEIMVSTGGGGWYGGGAGGIDTTSIIQPTYQDILEVWAGGGGGSGFTYSQATQSNVPNSYALTSQYWLTNTVNISGHDSGQKITSPEGTQEAGHNSGGYVRITVVDIFNGFFIGNSSGKAASIKSIYIGDSNGKARRVVKGYIGDANGKARRFL